MRIATILLLLTSGVSGQSSVDDFDPNANMTVRDVIVQPDGKILIAGQFSAVSGEVRFGIARLNPDGTLDPIFNPSANDMIFSMALQADGKVLVCGQFDTIGGQPRNHIARLDPITGQADSFNPNANVAVLAIAVQADGKIIAGGAFHGPNSIGGQTRNHLARLDPTTGLADSFEPNVSNAVFSVAVQPDGKILAGGSFLQASGMPRNNIARFDPITGQADSFDPNANQIVFSLEAQADGKILVGGVFTVIGGQARNRMARLNPDGTVDIAFDPNAADGSVLSMVVQKNGKILAGGYFTSIGGQTRNGIARLDAVTGLPDSFDPNANSNVKSVAVQEDGKILLGGDFTSLTPNGGKTVTRNRIARLIASSATVTPTPTPSCINDTWTATSTTNAPTRRQYGHTAVWTGNDMIVWGGAYFGSPPAYFNSGGRYNPSTDTWAATSTINVPTVRYFHTAIWTGSEMIVWGGSEAAGLQLNTGGRYNPSTDSWSATSLANAPSNRYGHTAVWTGNQMIVWGGSYISWGYQYPTRLLTYNAGTDTWSAPSTANAPGGRDFHTAIWTGSEMIVWGGRFQQDNGDATYYFTGGKYTPGTESWSATSTVNAPTGRFFQTAIWTGSEMIVWGGYDGSSLNTGGRYNPDTDSWSAINTVNAPSERYAHTAVWTGAEMIVWGGLDSAQNDLNTGARYNPNTDTWNELTTNNAPNGRDSQGAVWTGNQMIVWGGAANPIVGLNTGGKYCPPVIDISGNVSYCSNPSPSSVPNVMLTLTGDATLSSTTADSGAYLFSPPLGGNYIVTPSKAAQPPGSAGINTIDVVATQRHFLIIGTPLTGCRLTAADVNADNAVNTVDVVAIQRFFLVLPTGIANVGKYQFNPTSRSYSGIVSDQINQNYDALIYGDVASPFVLP